MFNNAKWDHFKGFSTTVTFTMMRIRSLVFLAFPVSLIWFPRLKLRRRDVSLAHVSSNNQHLACFHCQEHIRKSFWRAKKKTKGKKKESKCYSNIFQMRSRKIQQKCTYRNTFRKDEIFEFWYQKGQFLKQCFENQSKSLLLTLLTSFH